MNISEFSEFSILRYNQNRKLRNLWKFFFFALNVNTSRESWL